MKNFRIEISKGKLVNKNFLFEHLVNLEDGTYNLFVEKTQVGSAKYFFYRDVIAEHLGYGTRKEKEQLHGFLKEELLPSVFKNPDNLCTENYEEIDEYSTKWLSDQGWFNLNRALEIYAVSKWDVILK